MVCAQLLAVALLWAPAAHAQSDDERARMHFQAGSSYFEQGRYDDALREWQESYRLSNRHVLLRNIATAQERLFQFNDAIDSLQRYLSLGGAEAEENRNTIESRIEGLRRDAERFAASGGAPPTETTPTETTPTETTPTETTPIETTPTETTPTETEPVETEPVGGVEEESPRRLGTWISWGAAGLFGVGAIITGALALSKRGELQDDPGCVETSGVYNCPSELQPTGDSMHALAIVTDVFIGVGSAAAIIGLVLFFVEGRRGSSSDEARLRPTLGFGHAGLTLSF